MEFVAFPKIARLSRTIIVTEKIDGTNAQIHIDGAGGIIAGSRNRYITPEADNFGFAAWVRDNAIELLKLGTGTHYGEWWGSGIQRRYGLNEKRFSLFNTDRWSDEKGQRPECCDVVPTLYIGPFDTIKIEDAMSRLSVHGSVVAPGFMNPEGIVVFHSASRQLFKKTFEHDAEGKGENA